MLKKLNKQYLFLILILVIVFLINLITILKIPKQILFGDEAFYFDQAAKIREGKFINFQNTQPLLYPSFLSIFVGFNSTFLFRLVNLFLFIIALILFFIYSKKLFDNYLFSYIAMIIFAFNGMIMLLAVSIYTEILFFVFMLLCFMIFDKIEDENKIFPWLVFGLVLGLTLETRITGLFVAAFFLIYILIKNDFKFHHFISFFLAFLILIPWLLLGGFKFLFEKQVGSYFRIIGPFSFIFKYWLPFLPFLLFGIYVAFKEKIELMKKILLFCLVCFIILISFGGFMMFERHWAIIFPFLSIISVKGFEKIIKCLKNLRLNLFRIFFILLVISFFVFYFYINITNFKLPSSIYSQKLYLQIPENCIEIKEWKVNNKTVSLPVFDQKDRAVYSNITTLEEKYNKIILFYTDDYGSIKINNTLIGEMHDPLNPHIFYFNFTNESWKIDVEIINTMNVGGIGQVLICK
ncbi:MAG: hypothetical protein QXR88_01005 [Candidatus Pacearchaeota archaeon]